MSRLSSAFSNVLNSLRASGLTKQQLLAWLFKAAFRSHHCGTAGPAEPRTLASHAGTVGESWLSSPSQLPAGHLEEQVAEGGPGT